MQMPVGLDWMRGDSEKAGWWGSLPRLVDAQCQRWSLTPGEPFAGSHISLAMAVTRADRTPAVLKLQWPHPECEHEAGALRRWNGDGAVRLIDPDPDRHALLLERAEPGLYLSDGLEPDAALTVLAGLLPRLWVPAGAPFTTVADEAASWAESLPAKWRAAGEPFPRRLVDAALGFIADLVPTQPESVLLHQDLHGDNVVAAQREPWLAIDPKPLVGERAFGLAPIIRSPELGHSAAAVRRRLDRLSAETGVDRERARGWAVAQTLAWAFEGRTVHARHIETATWLLDG